MTSCGPIVVFITGLPACGKTTLARALAMEFTLPIVAKDEFKELLFDTLGSKDRAWSSQLGAASFAIFYKTIDTMLMTKTTFIVEADFSRPDLARATLKQLLRDKPHRVIEFNLVCDGNALFERFKARSLAGSRHPGHVDHLNFEEFKPMLEAGKREALNLGGLMLEVDSTAFSRERDLIEILRKELSPP